MEKKTIRNDLDQFQTHVLNKDMLHFNLWSQAKNAHVGTYLL